MKLNQYIRAILNNKLIPLIKKDKCEICGEIKNLEVHHKKLFTDILNEALIELNLEYKDTKEYSKKELSLISNLISGKHLNIKYLTLCKDCHINIHKDGWKDITYNNKHKQYFENLRLDKEKKEQENIKELIPYLESIVGKKLMKNDKEKLIDKINLKQEGKLLKSYNSLNDYLKEKGLLYVIFPKRNKYERWWEVIKQS